jgi:hypothetical protein
MKRVKARQDFIALNIAANEGFQISLHLLGLDIGPRSGCALSPDAKRAGGPPSPRW